MKKILSAFLATSMVMAACVAASSVASAVGSDSVQVPTNNGEFVVIEGENYSLADTYKYSESVQTNTYDVNGTTPHSQPKYSGSGVLLGTTKTTNEITFPVKIEIPIEVAQTTVYTFETVAAGGNTVYNTNQFTLDGVELFTTNTTPTVEQERLSWKTKTGNLSEYHEAVKYTTTVTINEGEHTLALVINKRSGNTNYGQYMLDYIKLTSCGAPGTDNPGTDNPGTDNPGTDNPGTDNPGTDNPGTDNPGTDNPGTVPEVYKTVKVDKNLTRFEMLESFNAGETKEIKFTPKKTDNYALFIGTGAYSGSDITSTVAALSFTIQDVEGTKIIENLKVVPSATNVQRLEPTKGLPVNLALEAGEEYTMSVTAETAGSVAYIDLRALTLEVGMKPTLISMLDYTSYPDATTYDQNVYTGWNKTIKWSQMGADPIGNYMDDEKLAQNNQLATAIRNISPTYKLNFKEAGTYKVTVYGANLTDIGKDTTVNFGASVSLDGESLGTAYYHNNEWTDDKASADIAKKTLSAMEIKDENKNTITVTITAGEHDLTVVPTPGNVIDILGVKIELAEPLVVDCEIESDEENYIAEYYIDNNCENEPSIDMIVILATYDENNVMIAADYVHVPANSTSTSARLSLPLADTTNARMFVWEGTDYLNSGDTSYKKSIVINNE